MKTTHTKGPWRVSPYHRKILGPTERSCATIIAKLPTATGPDSPHGYDEANAKLMAMAPDLLEACRQIVWKSGHNEESPGYSGPVRLTRLDATIRMAQAALDKYDAD